MKYKRVESMSKSKVYIKTQVDNDWPVLQNQI